jgi:hypothetical protein
MAPLRCQSSDDSPRAGESDHVAKDAPEVHCSCRAALSRHQPGWLSERLGMPRSQEERCIALLLETGQIRKSKGRLLPVRPLTVDTRRDAHLSRRMKAWCGSLAVQRLEQEADGVFSYNLFSISRADLARVQELHRAYFRELRRIVADSEPAECVALANVSLFELSPPRTPSGSAAPEGDALSVSPSSGQPDARVPPRVEPG